MEKTLNQDFFVFHVFIFFEKKIHRTYDFKHRTSKSKFQEASSMRDSTYTCSTYSGSSRAIDHFGDKTDKI